MKKTYKLINVAYDEDFGIDQIRESISKDGTTAFGVCRSHLDQYFEIDDYPSDTQYWVEISDKRNDKYGVTISRYGKDIRVDGKSMTFFTSAARLLNTILKEEKVYYVSMWKA